MSGIKALGLRTKSIAGEGMRSRSNGHFAPRFKLAARSALLLVPLLFPAALSHEQNKFSGLGINFILAASLALAHSFGVTSPLLQYIGDRIPMRG